jgi:1,4-dihydroxy-2-naphthoyl-CoA hydrolase
MTDHSRTGMPDGFEPVVPFDRCFDALYGLEIVSEPEEGLLRGRVPIRPEILGPAGGVHGGVFASVAEALASRGTAIEVLPTGFAAMGLSNDTTVVDPQATGALNATARLRARDDETWIWSVETVDDDGCQCALSRVTIAVRPLVAQS